MERSGTGLKPKARKHHSFSFRFGFLVAQPEDSRDGMLMNAGLCGACGTEALLILHYSDWFDVVGSAGGLVVTELETALYLHFNQNADIGRAMLLFNFCITGNEETHRKS